MDPSVHLNVRSGLGVGTQEIRQGAVERDELWERMRQRQQGRCALAARHEDTWNTQPKGAVSWWHMGEKPARGQVSSWQPAALCEHTPVSKYHAATGTGREE